jgi:replicative DNA helicase
VVPLDGLPTGFDNLDNITLGYKPGDLVILGAQTGHGKTAYALHTARAVSVDNRRNMLYLNTEMSREQIALRWGSILSGIEHERIRSGQLNETELSRVFAGYSRLRESGFYSYPCPNLTPEKTVSIGRKFKAQKNIDMMIIDYVGRMEKFDPRLQEWQMLEQIVKAQKTLAQNLKMVVICLVQLNPDGTLQGAKRMKNECDLMLKLRPIPKEELEENEQLKNYLHPNYYIEIEKNRDGRSGVKIPICFDLQKQIMKDAERIS